MTFYKIRTFLFINAQFNFSSNLLKKNVFIISLLAMLLSFSVRAGDVNDKELYIVNSCNTYKNDIDSPDTLACAIYIRGFFYGVLNAGNTDVLKLERESKSSSSFVQRAYANRVGKKTERRSVNYSCLTVDKLKDNIISKLSDDSLENFNSIKQVNALLVNTLIAACSDESKTNE